MSKKISRIKFQEKFDIGDHLDLQFSALIHTKVFNTSLAYRDFTVARVGTWLTDRVDLSVLHRSEAGSYTLAAHTVHENNIKKLD